MTKHTLHINGKLAGKRGSQTRTYTHVVAVYTCDGWRSFSWHMSRLNADRKATALTTATAHKYGDTTPPMYWRAHVVALVPLDDGLMGGSLQVSPSQGEIDLADEMQAEKDAYQKKLDAWRAFEGTPEGLLNKALDAVDSYERAAERARHPKLSFLVVEPDEERALKHEARLAMALAEAEAIVSNNPDAYEKLRNSEHCSKGAERALWYVA